MSTYVRYYSDEDLQQEYTFIPSAFELLALSLILLDLVLGFPDGGKITLIEVERKRLLQCGDLAVCSA